MELERLYEQRKAEERTPIEQQWDFKQINHRRTMLLGIASGQEQDIKVMKKDLGIVKDRVEQGFASTEQRFTSMEGKLEQVLLMLANLTPKIDK